ncbi:HEPN/Toprim-associated domain-containing protein [Mesorhizobium amorphae]|uniref:HEPN/Toprim-associated domain-containing protein n=1 Tax=Mesorhizobium amorphae TaxID=71433 RepID=UPI001AEDC682|nr:HEPN/Toprim-associated domain-containing protein [Mesorhizobium amorphae]
MGTEIALSIGGMDVAWSKNHRGIDHGSLFQQSDRGRAPSDQTDYEYYQDRDDPELALMEASFVRKLADMVPRLELLGHTLPSIELEYARAVEYWAENQSEEEPTKEALSFQEFIAFATKHAVGDLDDTLDLKLDDEKRKGRFASLSLVDNVPNANLWDRSFYSERSYFGSILDFLHPYSILRVLSNNAENLELNVTWQYGPLVEAGWAELDEFVGDARRRERFLIATEGSSDVHVLQHAFNLLRPGVSDFFRFVDVSEGHPFSGTGQLRKFAEGLAKIDVQNQTVFVFDNDAEGVEASQKVASMKLPANMRNMVLPDHDTLRSFPILGPDGVQTPISTVAPPRLNVTSISRFLVGRPHRRRGATSRKNSAAGTALSISRRAIFSHSGRLPLKHCRVLGMTRSVSKWCSMRS